MTQFGSTLASLLQLESKTQDELAAQSGVDRTTISRMLRGRVPSRKQLGALVTAISSDRSRRLELLLAHLRDEAASAQPAGIDERHFVIAPADDNPAATINVPGTLAADLQLIADECSENEPLRDVVTDFARMIMLHRAQLADVYPFPNDNTSQVAENPPPVAGAKPAKKNRATPANGLRRSDPHYLPEQPGSDATG